MGSAHRSISDWVNYSHFGPHGRTFQRYHEWIVSETIRVWVRNGGSKIRPDKLAKYWDAAFCWYHLLQVAGQAVHGHRESAPFATVSMTSEGLARMSTLWARLAAIFTPNLPTDNLTGEVGRIANGLYTTRITLGRRVPANLGVPEDICNICYGPFSINEMLYLTHHQTRIVEVACGSGYAAAQLLAAGVDIVAMDSNRYGLTDPPRYPWTAALRERGRLVIDDGSSIGNYANRALLISRPEPGSSFPETVIRAYAQAGGRTLLFKLGGYSGTWNSPDPAYVPPTHPHENVLRFIEYLAAEWHESRSVHRPPYAPLATSNNLWVFEKN